MQSGTGELSALGSIGDFLSHGGLGLMALALVVVLGYNTRSLYILVRDGQPDRVGNAAPLLKANMAISGLGLILFAAIGLYLMSGERKAMILLDPSADSDPLFQELKLIKVDGKPVSGDPILVSCRNADATSVKVDFRKFMDRKAALAIKAQAVLLAPGEGLAVDR